MLASPFLWGASRWNPGRRSGLFMLFDCVDKSAANMTLVSGNLSSLTDKVSGVAFTQATAGSRPTDNPWGASFDGVDDNLAYTAGAVPGWPLQISSSGGAVDFFFRLDVLSDGAGGTRTILAYPNTAVNGLSFTRLNTDVLAIARMSIGTSTLSISCDTSPLGAFKGRHTLRGTNSLTGSRLGLDKEGALVNASVAMTLGTNTRHRLGAAAGSSAASFGIFNLNMALGFSPARTAGQAREIIEYLNGR